MTFCSKFISWIKDPLDIRGVVNHINVKASELQGDILHSHKRHTELMKAFMSLDKQFNDFMFFKAVEEGLDDAIPDMLWAKDIYGKYVVANKAIRDKLLFDDYPRGKDDKQLSKARKLVIGNDNHTFGEMCGDSDLIVLGSEIHMTFVEEGIVSGKRLILKVHKNVIRDAMGEIIGTVGVGKDITDEYAFLEDIRETTTCSDTKFKITELLLKNKFCNKDTK